jgi:L-alanine-DL-glutamate epimerase-like enolase superfamily enzyme
MPCTIRNVETAIKRLEVSAYQIPTDQPEADGTYSWDSTTLVVVRASAAGRHGLGYTYADTATAHLIHDLLTPRVLGSDALDVPAAWTTMTRAVRNLGRPGICAMAIAAVDNALWDLKARLLDLPLVKLLGSAHESVTIYGSGGFTSYSIARLKEQLVGWAEEGIPRVKMKVGTHPEDDLARVRAARLAVGPQVELFVDANGAYGRKQALRFAQEYAELGVSWFEEPVAADDVGGLRLLRDRAPAGLEIAAGEYGYELGYFRRLLEAGAVDVVQADATRCAGISGFLQAAALCQAYSLELSAHCAPALHVHPCCAIEPLRHLEYFHDHVRIEQLVFEGTLTPVKGALHPDLSRPGLGLELKQAGVRRYLVWTSEESP